MGGLICFVPDANAPGKKDMSGAFFPEAVKYARFQGQDPKLVIKPFPATGPLPARRAPVIAALSAMVARVDTVAFFCHGYYSGLQCGFTLANVMTLARLLAEHATPSATVVLYACNAGGSDGDNLADLTNDAPGGDGGFADALRDACDVQGREVTVVAHETAGHCTWNPRARRFSPHESIGGRWYVAPGTPLWPLWVTTLRDPLSTLRFRFPHMTPGEVQAELSAPRRVG